MQAQFRNAGLSQRRPTPSIKPSTRLITKRNRLKPSNLAFRLTTMATDGRNDTSTDTTPSQEPLPNDFSAPPSGQQAASTQQWESSGKFDKDKALPLFQADLNKIEILRKQVEEGTEKYRGKIQQKAISALATILGIRQKYFSTDDITVSAVFYKELYESVTGKKFRKISETTTEFHLLSRLLRGQDRRQASSDAKILTRAHKEGVTEMTFSAWVLKHGGLNAVKNVIAEQERTDKPRTGKSASKSSCGARLTAALFAAAKADILREIASVEIEDLKRISRMLVPEVGTTMPALIRRDPQGNLTVHTFTHLTPRPKASARSAAPSSSQPTKANTE